MSQRETERLVTSGAYGRIGLVDWVIFRHLDYSTEYVMIRYIFLKDRTAFEDGNERGVFMEMSLSPKFKGIKSPRDVIEDDYIRREHGPGI